MDPEKGLTPKRVIRITPTADNILPPGEGTASQRGPDQGDSVLEYLFKRARREQERREALQRWKEGEPPFSEAEIQLTSRLSGRSKDIVRRRMVAMQRTSQLENWLEGSQPWTDEERKTAAGFTSSSKEDFAQQTISARRKTQLQDWLNAISAEEN